nr:S26 family signal peptidase [Asticcacaulis aquaticus]
MATSYWGGITPHIVYNASASAPLGFYHVRPIKALNRGDLVLMTTPELVRDMADRRRYLPATVPMIKTVAALAGDEVCASDHRILINGRPVATRQRHDAMSRPLPHWNGCHHLRSDEFFPLNTDAPHSFDGRYFGVVSVALIQGKLNPL